MRHIVELELLLQMLSFEALGDVRHGRDSRTLNLTTKAEVSRDHLATSQAVNVARELPRLLPAFQIFKCHKFCVLLCCSLSAGSILPSSLSFLLAFSFDEKAAQHEYVHFRAQK